MSDIFPEGSMTILGCQVLIVVIPLVTVAMGIGVCVGWLIWGG